MTASSAPEDQDLPSMLEKNGGRFSSRTALLGEGDEPLLHSRLWEQVASTVPVLNSLGIGRGDPVGIVLPQGPHLAVAFL
jgi:acyl-CoA synthetase (AMP-forming)/AMP-acid ligase II